MGSISVLFFEKSSKVVEGREARSPDAFSCFGFGVSGWISSELQTRNRGASADLRKWLVLWVSARKRT